MIVVFDDVRIFKVADLHCRTIQEMNKFLTMIKHPAWNRRIDQLWLDHDLGADDTIMPVVSGMERAAYSGYIYPIDKIYVHTSNEVGGRKMMIALSNWYDCERVCIGKELAKQLQYNSNMEISQ